MLSDDVTLSQERMVAYSLHAMELRHINFTNVVSVVSCSRISGLGT